LVFRGLRTTLGIYRLLISCSVADVNAALDHHLIELDRDTFLKRTLAMELVELDECSKPSRKRLLLTETPRQVSSW